MSSGRLTLNQARAMQARAAARLAAATTDHERSAAASVAKAAQTQVDNLVAKNKR